MKINDYSSKKNSTQPSSSSSGELDEKVNFESDIISVILAMTVIAVPTAIGAFILISLKAAIRRLKDILWISVSLRGIISYFKKV